MHPKQSEESKACSALAASLSAAASSAASDAANVLSTAADESAAALAAVQACGAASREALAQATLEHKVTPTPPPFSVRAQDQPKRLPQ